MDLTGYVRHSGTSTAHQREQAGTCACQPVARGIPDRPPAKHLVSQRKDLKA